MMLFPNNTIVIYDAKGLADLEEHYAQIRAAERDRIDEEQCLAEQEYSDGEIAHEAEMRDEYNEYMAELERDL
jgi:hypothetical protein